MKRVEDITSSGSTAGLSSAEARRRLDQFGHNTIDNHRQKSLALTFLSKFNNPLVIILLLASIASLFLGDITSGLIIITIVIISTTLDFLNTYRSDKAVSALQKTIRITARVRRDGNVKSIPLANIVPGDIVELTAGSIIPGDGEVVEFNDLCIDESAITGESYPVPKEIGQPVYMGSSVANGGGAIKITATGKNTEYAKIARSLERDTPTAFDIELAKFSALIAKITVGLVVFILAISLFYHHDPISSLLFALALAVGLTPELLPLIVTINLTKGSIRMSKKGVIVKRLSAIQNFGSMDILCTDKTGTLTQNQIAIAKVEDFHNTESRRALELAATVCHFTTSYESPMDLAILKFTDFKFHHQKKLLEIPFDFERKRESVVISSPEGDKLITKGAADGMLDIINRYRDTSGRAKRLTPANRNRLLARYHELSSEGYRILAVASKEIDPDRQLTKADETNMVFEGYIAFIDPPKPNAKKSLETLLASGITVKIITGDDPLVAGKIASDLNIPTTSIMTGDEISKLNRLQLDKKVSGATIFARVNPSQKLAIIESLRRQGHVVGYMGDGINDAPSLRAADVGISVNNAVDVAKDAADVILMGKSLRYLYDGVIEGRRTFANTMKYIKMALSSNFGNMFSMAGSALFLPFLPMTAPQILLNNLLYDSSQFALPADNVDPEELAKPHRMNIKSIVRFMWVFGTLSSLFDFVTFGVLLIVLHAGAGEFQAGWFLESLLTQTLVVFIFRTHRAAVLSKPSKYLLFSIGLVAIIAVAVVTTLIAGELGFATMNIHQIAIIGLIVGAYLLLAEILKLSLARRINMP